MNPFKWLRLAAKASFMGGIQDAVEEISDAGAITIRVELPALPAPVAAVKDKPKSKN